MSQVVALPHRLCPSGPRRNQDGAQAAPGHKKGSGAVPADLMSRFGSRRPATRRTQKLDLDRRRGGAHSRFHKPVCLADARLPEEGPLFADARPREIGLSPARCVLPLLTSRSPRASAVPRARTRRREGCRTCAGRRASPARAARGTGSSRSAPPLLLEALEDPAAADQKREVVQPHLHDLVLPEGVEVRAFGRRTLCMRSSVVQALNGAPQRSGAEQGRGHTTSRQGSARDRPVVSGKLAA